MGQVVGRDEELAALEAFLDRVSAEPAALLLEGEPGAGKTTLWRAGVAAARDRSLRTLIAQPAEAESSLPFAALADLLDGVAEEVMAKLPGPQADALRAALLLDGVGGGVPDRRAVAVAILNALRTLARSRPLLVAVDDAQWLDAPSARALEFVVRRLHAEPIALLVAARGPNPSLPLGLQRAPGLRLVCLEIGGLSFGALHEVLRRRTGHLFARPVLRRLHETSKGNPFFALELARALDRKGTRLGAGEPLPVPHSLQQLLRDRLESLPTEAREALLVAAALANPTREAVASAFPRSGDDAVDAAVGVGVLEVDGGRVRVAHPLLASNVYAAAAPRRRRSLHRRLADLAAEPEERARHLALAAHGPDEELAAEAEAAAGHARARGAPESAAELLEQARALTPPDRPGEAWRRSIAAAENYHECGALARSRALLEDVVSAAPRGGVRGRALQLLGCVASRDGGFKTALPLYEAAAAEVEDTSSRALIDADLVLAYRQSGDVAAAAAHGEATLARAEELENPWLLRDLLVGLAYDNFILARGLRADLLERADALGAGSRPHVFQDMNNFVRTEMRWSLLLAWIDELDAARAKLEALRTYVMEEHLDASMAYVLAHLCQVEWLAGNWERALSWAAACEEEALQSGALVLRQPILFCRGHVAAHTGDTDDAIAAAEEGLELAERTGHWTWPARFRALLGFVALSVGDAAGAHAQLARAAQLAASSGGVEPSVLRWQHNDVEALVTLGELGQAEELTELLEKGAQALATPWSLALAARCRGLIAAARGNLPTAESSLEQALEAHHRVEDRFEHARTLLVLGGVRRRARRKRASRDALGEALQMFELLGATRWAEKARGELARISGRAPARAGLTPTERHVARLVAEGRATKEVARELFMSTKTVEGHLSHIYGKLGIRSRTELAARFAAHS